ncbi:MAG: hypothetical protein ACTHMS_03435 [Jatrophihabitans sp.]|uniref:hypothetical protein n=1 Tax=Jatrophihabitans sp. TaxID=1932789 RepID=UPI003F7D3B0F
MTIAGMRVGSMSVDGTPISSADLARIEAEERLHVEMQIKTVRVIAGASRDAAECRSILDMLGIDSATVLAARGTGHDAPTPDPAPRRGKRRVAAA